MKELRYGRHMLNYNLGNGDTIKWIFPENIHINNDTLYEVEYQEIDSSDPSKKFIKKSSANFQAKKYKYNNVKVIKITKEMLFINYV